MTARFYADMALVSGASVSLPEHAARHVQVLRLQPGDRITLFNGKGNEQPGLAPSEGEFDATITRMGRSDVDVSIGAYTATRRETPRAVHLVLGMPANERMDWLIEKATELGVTSIQPLMTERSVLRLKGERADKKLAHWRGIAAATSEQCGRNRVPVIHDVMSLSDWLRSTPNHVHAGDTAASTASGTRMLLSLQAGTRPLAEVVKDLSHLTPLSFLSGPEGGLSPAEETSAIAHGFTPVTLGPRVLRSETAPLACLAFLALMPGV